MGVIWLVVRADGRRRWPALIVLLLIVAVVVAVAIASLVGARRSAVSVDRFREWSADHDIGFAVGDADAVATVVATLRDRSDVAAVAPFEWANAVFPNEDLGQLNILLPADDEMAASIDRPRLLTGRMPDPAATDEVLLNETAARILRWSPGLRVSMLAWSREAIASMSGDADVARIPAPTEPLDVEIVGVGRFASDLIGEVRREMPFALAGPGFARAHPDVGGWQGRVHVRLRPGADRDAVIAAVRAEQAADGAFVEVRDPRREYAESATNTARTEALALLVTATMVAVGGAYVAGQAIRRQVNSTSELADVARRLGLRPITSALARAAAPSIAGVTGVLLGAMGAVLLSPVFPFGLARRADLDDGVAAHAQLVLPLAGVAAVIIVAGALVMARRTHALTPHGAPRSGFERVLRGTRGPVPMSTGARLAFGRGRHRPAVSGAVAALLLATASGVGALLVASNANALEAQPSRWGWTWTARPNDLDIVDRAGFEAFLRDDPRLDVVARLDQRYVVPVTANGTPIEATTGIAFLSVRGDLGPTVRSGRLPATASEVALGADTMRALHAAIGDVVSFTDSEGVAVTKLTVVGDVILPQPQYGSTRITEGAVMLPEALEELAHDEAWTDLLLGYAPEIDAAALERDLRAFGAQFDVYSRPTPPGAVTALHEARHVGELLALAFVPLALLTVVHASLVSAREHARELATLRALGLRGGQVGTALAVEAGLLGLVAAALGAPVGLLWGRWAWRVLVDSTGALTVMTVPAVFLVSAVLGVVIVTVAIGWTCGRPLGSGAPGRLLRAGFAP